MKKIATSVDGKIIVEMSNIEWSYLSALIETASGGLFDWDRYSFQSVHEFPESESIDALLAIRAWFAGKGMVNEMRRAIDRLDGVLMKGDSGIEGAE
jgi:hypothetical protein